MRKKRENKKHFKWLYLAVEIQYREFDSRLLLACFAAIRGYKVIIGEQNKLWLLLNRSPSGLFLDKSLAQAKRKLISNIRAMGHIIASIDEEGLAVYRNPEEYTTVRFCSENLEKASIVFTWSDTEKNEILKKYPKYKEKIFVTGNPRIDIWCSEFKKIYLEKAERIKKGIGKFILFPSNFGLLAFPENIGNYFNFLYNRGDIKSPSELSYFFQMLAHKIRVLEEYISLIKEISKCFPEYTVLVRPHPSESNKFWKERLSDCKNVIIEHKDVVTPYIMAAECLIHNGCTTGFESFFIGTPSIAYLPFYNKVYDYHPSVDLSVKCYNKEEVIEMLKKILYKKKKISINDSKILSDFKFNKNTGYACEEMLNYIDNINLPLSSFSFKNQFFVEVIKILFSSRKIYTKIKNIFRKKHKEIKRNPKWPGTTLYEVRQKVKIFSEINPLFKDIEVKQLYKNLFLIQKKWTF